MQPTKAEIEQQQEEAVKQVGHAYGMASSSNSNSAGGGKHVGPSICSFHKIVEQQQRRRRQQQQYLQLVFWPAFISGAAHTKQLATSFGTHA
jgi:hypothetical protein